jgi:hypothetical protein
MVTMWRPVSSDSQDLLRANTLDVPANIVRVEDAKYTGINISSYYFDVHAMAELGFGELTKLSSKAHISFFMLEIACYTDTVLVEGIQPKELSLARRGLAVRVGIANWGIEFKAASTIAAVAANAQLGLSSTAIQLKISGRSRRVIELAEPISRLTEFTADSLKTISECTAKIAAFFESDGKTLEPTILQVAPLDVGPFSWVHTVYSGQFAVESIYRGRSADDSLDLVASRPNDSKYIVPGYVQSVYAGLGIRRASESPNSDQRATAHEMLLAGRY